MTTSISLRGVRRRFGATWALADVSLELEPGVIGLLGPNGAGKTTLLRLLATALPPSQGELTVLGRDPAVPAQRTEVRRGLGYLPQEIGFPVGSPRSRSWTTSRCSRNGPSRTGATPRSAGCSTWSA